MVQHADRDFDLVLRVARDEAGNVEAGEFVFTVPRREWSAAARASGLGDYQVETLLEMFRYYERSGMAGAPRVLGCLLGRAPTSFEEFVARTAADPPETR